MIRRKSNTSEIISALINSKISQTMTIFEEAIELLSKQNDTLSKVFNDIYSSIISIFMDFQKHYTYNQPTQVIDNTDDVKISFGINNDKTNCLISEQPDYCQLNQNGILSEFPTQIGEIPNEKNKQNATQKYTDQNDQFKKHMIEKKIIFKNQSSSLEKHKNHSGEEKMEHQIKQNEAEFKSQKNKVKFEDLDEISMKQKIKVETDELKTTANFIKLNHAFIENIEPFTEQQSESKSDMNSNCRFASTMENNSISVVLNTQKINTQNHQPVSDQLPSDASLRQSLNKLIHEKDTTNPIDPPAFKTKFQSIMINPETENTIELNGDANVIPEEERPLARSKTPSKKPNSKFIPINQLLEFIDIFFDEKRKFDNHNLDQSTTRISSEEFLFLYLKNKYGLKELIIQQALFIVTCTRFYQNTDYKALLFTKVR